MNSTKCSDRGDVDEHDRERAAEAATGQPADGDVEQVDEQEADDERPDAVAGHPEQEADDDGGAQQHHDAWRHGANRGGPSGGFTTNGGGGSEATQALDPDAVDGARSGPGGLVHRAAD